MVINDWGLFRVVGLFTCFLFLVGCASVGPPIPPEEVGIAAKIRKQQKEKEQAERSALADQETTSTSDEDVELPTFYPIGVR